MNEVDERVFAVIYELKKTGKIKYIYEVYETLGIQKQNFYIIKGNENAHFTVVHIYKLIKKYNIPPGNIFN